VSYAPAQAQDTRADTGSHEEPYDGGPRYEVNGRLTSGVGWRLNPFTKRKWEYHRGWDIAMPDGSPVRPSLPGSVIYSGWYGGYGWLIAVDHGNGYVTMYGHNRRNLAVTGTNVDANTIIALSGSSGRTTGPHLHYEIRKR